MSGRMFWGKQPMLRMDLGLFAIHKNSSDFKAKTIKNSILENFAAYYRDTILGLDNESLAELVFETILPRLEKMILNKLNAA